MVFEAEEHLDVPTKDILSWCFDEPQCPPDSKIYIDAFGTSRAYTWRQARDTIRKLIAGFRASGLKKGDVVCIHSFNDISYPIVVNAIVGAGLIYSGTNPGYQAYELAHAVKTAGIKFFITEPDVLKNVVKAADDTGISRDSILVFDTLKGHVVPDGFKSWRTLLEHGEEDWVRFDDLETCKKTVAARMFSSGTTGLPKAAIITHYNLIYQHSQVNEWRPRQYEPRRLKPMPMFHMATTPSMHFSPLRNGVPTFVMRRFEVDSFLAAVERHRITEITSVPPMIVSIINSDARKKYSLASIRYVSCGAAPLEKSQQAKFQQLLSPGATFTQAFGMTETTCLSMMFPPPEDDDTGSIGRPVPGLDIKLVDDDNRDISDYNVRGEMCFRGPTVIPGYLNEDATKGSWDADGFFHSGDIAYCDKATRKWYIVDRKKELIKVRGFQVAPPELEGVLLDHPHIVDAAVIGVTFPGDKSEYPRAYVVRRASKEGQRLDPDAVKAYMAERLAKYKRLDGGVVLLDEIPKNPSGKILKRELRERAQKEIKQERPSSKL